MLRCAAGVLSRAVGRTGRLHQHVRGYAAALDGLMQDHELVLTDFVTRAETVFPYKKIITR